MVGGMGRDFGHLNFARSGGASVRPVRLTTFGDSTSNFSNLTTTDVSAWSSAFSAGTTQMNRNFTKLLLPAFYPQSFLVGDGGISGQNTTQMLARSGLGASSTRKAIEDIIALRPHAVLLRGGSINDLVGFTPPITQANIDGVVSRHQQIIAAFVAAGIWVVDTGIMGYSGATNTAQVQAALLNFNQQMRSYSSSKFRFVDLRDVTFDSTTGAFLSGISGDGTHLQNKGQFTVAPLEAAALTAIFGASQGVRFSGSNVIPNYDLSSSGSSGVGTTGTGWSFLTVNCTNANAKIETINGIVMQTCEFTPTADNASGIINIPFGVTGASPSIVISANQVYGFEADFYVAGLAGAAPPAGSTLFRIDLFKGTPRNIYSCFEDGSSDALGGVFTGRAIFEPVTIPDFGGSQANLTASDYRLQFNAGISGDRTAFKIGVGNPRMVLIG